MLFLLSLYKIPNKEQVEEKEEENTQSIVTSQVKIGSNYSGSEVEGAKDVKEEYDTRLFKETTIY